MSAELLIRDAETLASRGNRRRDAQLTSRFFSENNHPRSVLQITEPSDFFFFNLSNSYDRLIGFTCVRFYIFDVFDLQCRTTSWRKRTSDTDLGRNTHLSSCFVDQDTELFTAFRYTLLRSKLGAEQKAEVLMTCTIAIKPPDDTELAKIERVRR